MWVNCGPPAASPIAKARRLVVRSRASTVMPVAVASIPAAGRFSASMFGRRPVATSRCEAAIRSPPVRRTTMASPSRSTEAISTRGCAWIPSLASLWARQAASSRSSRGSNGPTSSTVTREPSLRCACAISMPIGPPPITVGEDGLVREIGNALESRDLRNCRARAGGDHEPPRPDFDFGGVDGARAGEARFGLQYLDSEPLEPLDGIVRRDRRNYFVNTVVNRREVDLRTRGGNTECRAVPRDIGVARSGEQRLRRDAAEIEAIAAHHAALDQDDFRAHLRRSRRDRERDSGSSSALGAQRL